MDWKLFWSALRKFFSGLLLVGLLVFLPAGSFAFRQGWLLMGVLFVPMFGAGLVMLAKSPELLRRRLNVRLLLPHVELLRRRLNVREEQSAQKRVIAWSGLMFLAAFLLAGLNFRFGWHVLPFWVSAAAAVLFLLGYLLYAEVLRENVWLSRTIEVQEQQTVVDTGLYGVVRHPMYAATLLLFFSMPLILGSLLSFAVMLLYLPIIASRIRGEEALLERELQGYSDYKKRVKYRILPGIW